MIVIMVGAFAAGTSAMENIAAAGRLPVPLNEILPRLPPVPEPLGAPQSFGLCGFSSDIIPLGDMTPATVAHKTPDGIALLGGEADAAPSAAESSPCPIAPD